MLASADGVLAAKLQEASLAAQAALDKDSKEQGMRLQCAPNPKPQTTNHKPQTTNHKPQTTNRKPQTAHH